MCLNNAIKAKLSEIKENMEPNSYNYEDFLEECCYTEPEQFKNWNLRGLNVLQMNVRGLQSKITNIENMLIDLKASKCDIDILLLSETHKHANNINLVRIPGYREFHNYRKNKKGGGVSIYIKEKFMTTALEQYNVFLEGRFESMTIELKLKKRNLLISSVYRPPNTSLSEFDRILKRYLETLREHSDNIVIGGDFNIDLTKSYTVKSTSEFIDTMLEFELFPTITIPTRVTMTSATLIDNIFISRNIGMSYKSFVLCEDISDHLPTFCNIKDCNTSIPQNPLIIEKRNLNESAIIELNNNLMKVNWNHLKNFTDVNECYTSFTNTLKTKIDEVAPIKVIKINPKNRIKLPWITSGIRQSQKRLRKFFKKSQSDPVKNVEYKHQRNLLNRAKRLSKINYFRQKLLEYKGNTRKVWGLINKLIGKLNNKQNIIQLLKTDTGELREGQTIADKLCDFFANIGVHTAQQLNLKNQSGFKQITPCETSIYMKPIDQTEISNLIYNLPNKSSCGIDGYSNIFLKQIQLNLLEPLHIIFNLSISTSVFPEDMKLALVTLLHKARERYLITNYRPISLLITISKLLEKCIETRMTIFLEKNNLLMPTQFGFRRIHSTTDAVMSLTSKILKSIEEKKIFGCIYIDLSKAFDTLNHKMILNKLERLGIRGAVNNLLNSYLLNRSMKVKCNTDSGKNISRVCKLSTGVPQGSILGPLLFSCATVDINLNLYYCNCIAYADDTTLYSSEKKVNLVLASLEHDMSILVSWFKQNHLKMNPEKTQFQIFGNFNKKYNPKLIIDDCTIYPSHSVKLLGIHIDTKLSWDTHINMLKNRLRSSLFMFKSCKNYLDLKCRLMFYYSHFYSYIQYGISIWGSMLKKSDLKQLSIAQRKFIRCIVNAKYNAHTDPIYKELKLLKIESIIKLEQVKLFYKINNRSCPSEILKEFKFNYGKSTRNKSNPNPPKHSTSRYNNSFLIKGISNWNSLPYNIKNKPTFNSFKSSAKKFIFEKQC